MRHLTENTIRELQELARAAVIRGDNRVVPDGQVNPLIKDGRVDIDAYIGFVTHFNELSNHEPKPFKPMTGDYFRL